MKKAWLGSVLALELFLFGAVSPGSQEGPFSIFAPDDDPASTITNRTLGRTGFQLYWNIPTFQCASHKVNFTELARKYHIRQNEQDRFRGATIAILYDPGAFPAILRSDRTSRVVLRNGGVPQEGNLTYHLVMFKEKVDELIPDRDFPGVGIIDFESWRPIFRQNFGTLAPYKQLSTDIEKQLHPFWPNFLVEKEARRRFELFARIFMEETLIYARNLRPNATWGYYAYPYCFNMSPNNMRTECPDQVVKENDGASWLFNASNNIHPSLYLFQKTLTPKQRIQMITGRIDESHRIVGYLGKPTEPLILPYFWYKYHDSEDYLTKEDVYNSFDTLRRLSIDGLILWGSSDDVNTKQKCETLYDYVDSIIGPALLQFAPRL